MRAAMIEILVQPEAKVTLASAKRQTIRVAFDEIYIVACPRKALEIMMLLLHVAGWTNCGVVVIIVVVDVGVLVDVAFDCCSC